MTETKQTSTTKTDRRPDCVTEISTGNSLIPVPGFIKPAATDTPPDNMLPAMGAAAPAGHTPRPYL